MRTCQWFNAFVSSSLVGSSSLYLTRDDLSPALHVACALLDASESDLHRDDFLQRLLVVQPVLSAAQRRVCIGPIAATRLRRSLACTSAPEHVRDLVAMERLILEAHCDDRTR